MYRNQKFLHMAGFSQQVAPVVPVTNMRFARYFNGLFIQYHNSSKISKISIFYGLEFNITWWPRLELKARNPLSDQICNQSKWCHLVLWKDIGQVRQPTGFDLPLTMFLVFAFSFIFSPGIYFVPSSSAVAALVYILWCLCRLQQFA